MYTCYNLFVALDTGHQEISNNLHHYWRGADHGVVVFQVITAAAWATEPIVTQTGA